MRKITMGKVGNKFMKDLTIKEIKHLLKMFHINTTLLVNELIRRDK